MKGLGILGFHLPFEEGEYLSRVLRENPGARLKVTFGLEAVVVESSIPLRNFGER